MRTHRVAGKIASAAGLALVVGFFLGFLVFAPASPRTSLTPQQEELLVKVRKRTQEVRKRIVQAKIQFEQLEKQNARLARVSEAAEKRSGKK